MNKNTLSARCLYFLPAIFLLAGCSAPEQPGFLLTGPISDRIDSLIAEMTLEEKIGMIHANSSFTTAGVPRLGIPEWVMSDGPHGVRMEHGRDWVADDSEEDSCTYLPVGVCLAATWNPDLGYRYGTVLGSEARYRGKDVILGPGINIIRTPLNGRNFEYMSEDPFLISRMAVGYIRGVQEQDVAACVKHYAANNQEWERHTIDVEMSERALREIYLPGFEAAVRDGGASTVMGAYNKFRGQFTTHHQYLINDILKGEWGFDGAVISDWGAVKDTYEAAVFGCDVEMGTDLGMLPNPDYSKFFMADRLLEMVRKGEVAEELIDDKVRRILRIMDRSKVFEERKPGAFASPEHMQAAREIAAEGIVLLKNDLGILPLDKSGIRTIAVIGQNATYRHAGAGGSSQVKAKYEVTPLEGLQQLVGDEVELRYSPGYSISKEAFDNAEQIRQAAEMAASSDLAIVVGGLIRGYSNAWADNAYDAEGLDKPDMLLPFNQDALIRAVVKANPRTVVVLLSGGPVDMQQWIADVPALIQAWYPGSMGGYAIADVLFGVVNPSGKLPMTFPKKLEDSPAHALGEYPGQDGRVRYLEDLLVGYRYFDTRGVDPLFCFGHGLSYTSFEYRDLSIEKTDTATLKVSLSVRNTGNRAGAEVVQLYVSPVDSPVERPDRELKAFSKVMLAPGEHKDITFDLDDRAFSYFDDTTMRWALHPGKFRLLVGASSRDIRLHSAASR
jgi:beta-glucosidase